MIHEIDPADPSVAARIVEIQRAAYTVEAELMGFDGIPPLHETHQAVAALSHLEWLGAHEDELLVGLIAWTSPDDVIEIDRLAVDPAFGRRGHGRRLVEAVVGRGDVVTVSTGAANSPARRLYESVGFAVESIRDVAPGVGVVTMRLARDQ